MSDKIYIPEGEAELAASVSQIGTTLDALASTIEARRSAGDESYTHRLLTGDLDKLLKKVSEEALESALAAKETQMLDAYSTDDALIDASRDHLRYEAADVVYHLLVLLARFDISIDEFAAELNSRMSDAECPEGCVRIKPEHVKRGK